MVESHQRAMEMEQHETKIVAKRRRTILDKVTHLEKGMNIPNPE
jgi:hypothetical protein